MKTNKTLIEQLYSEKDCEHIKELYKDASLREHLQRAIGEKLFTDNTAILTNCGVDVFFLVCSTANFATIDESNRVALIVFNNIKIHNPLPCLLDHHGVELAERSFVSLSFFYKRLEHRWRYKGSPAPETYRNLAKHIFAQHNNEDISEHFEKWENFLSERFI
jgi:hypothetical protein